MARELTIFRLGKQAVASPHDSIRKPAGYCHPLNARRELNWRAAGKNLPVGPVLQVSFQIRSSYCS
jgi:hypothetical protein